MSELVSEGKIDGICEGVKEEGRTRKRKKDERDGNSIRKILMSFLPVLACYINGKHLDY